MSKHEQFQKAMQEGYTFDGDSIVFGGAMLDGVCIKNTLVRAPLKVLNRHGLIAGATGTGKTKTLQLIAESLSDKGVPVLMMDLKGDLSGLAKPGDGHPKIDERHQKIGLPHEPSEFPVEFGTLSQEKGFRLRATVSEFGPVLFSKILGLNETQSGIVAVIFQYCDNKKLPLLDLKDFKKVLQFINDEGKAEVEKEYGQISGSSINTILRKTIELEQQGADLFFGEKSFEVEDLLRTDSNGRGYITVLRLTDIQTRPKLFSSFVLSLLAEMYSSFLEVGDMEKPKLILFIDEAHVVFEEATQALLDQIETIIKLIRSKGVGIFFCTQNPSDIPEDILGQLGMKVQHALRAFTAKDRKMIKMTAENYPLSDFYKTDEVLTSLGIGEALVTVLSERGIPTPLAATLLMAPRSRMGILGDHEIDEIIRKSDMTKKYNEVFDRESAYEILNEKLVEFQEPEKQKQHQRDFEQVKPRGRQKSALGGILDSTLGRQVGRTVAREVTRGLLGVLGLGGTTRRRRRSRKSLF